jgi:hypothetical protein
MKRETRKEECQRWWRGLTPVCDNPDFAHVRAGIAPGQPAAWVIWKTPCCVDTEEISVVCHECYKCIVEQWEHRVYCMFCEAQVGLLKNYITKITAL